VAVDILVTPQSVFRLAASSGVGAIQLSPETWRVIAQIDGARTIGEIAENLKTDSTVVQKAAENLFRLGLLREGKESDEPVRTTVDRAFFDHIEKEFVKMIGPFGTVLIDDELGTLGATRETFPRDKVAELVERLSVQITEDDRRIRFQQVMLEAIRKA
jgi:hypothetical protein